MGVWHTETDPQQKVSSDSRSRITHLQARKHQDGRQPPEASRENTDLPKPWSQILASRTGKKLMGGVYFAANYQPISAQIYDIKRWWPLTGIWWNKWDHVCKRPNTLVGAEKMSHKCKQKGKEGWGRCANSWHLHYLLKKEVDFLGSMRKLWSRKLKYLVFKVMYCFWQDFHLHDLPHLILEYVSLFVEGDFTCEIKLIIGWLERMDIILERLGWAKMNTILE